MAQDNLETIRGLYAAFARGDFPTVLGALDAQVEWIEAENFIYADRNPYVGPQGTDAQSAEKFERAVTLCAGLAWHFNEINSVMEFRSAGFATPRMIAGEIIYDILRHLASVTPLKPQPGP